LHSECIHELRGNSKPMTAENFAFAYYFVAALARGFQR